MPRPSTGFLPSLVRALERFTDRTLRRLDAAFTRLFGWRYHPLHQTGPVAVALLVVLIVTGLYLLIFYRISAPWSSVQRIVADPWIGRWVRSLHRFASDAMIVAVVAHAVRLFAQERSWGPRALAWISGVTLLLFLFISGWTGFVIVWDTFGARLAVAGARLFDTIPILSEPVQRVFSGERPIPGAFFFVNLFLHVAIPLGAAAGLWIHISRLARPTLLPPRALGAALIGGLVVLALVLPAPLPPEANPFAIPSAVPVDWFYAFWLPVVTHLPPWAAWTGAIATFALAVSVPRFTRRPREGAYAPSIVDERLCTGCNQCPQDCPWEAITMIPRTDGRTTLVARVDPALCVSCGLCAGSCAPMGVGPASRTGRDQLQTVRQLMHAAAPDGDRPAPVVAVLCEQAPTGARGALERAGATVHPINCTGNLHTSAVELLLRSGAAGVIVFSCAPRDCRGREGPKWLEHRMYHDREAELQPRVDRRRVRLTTSAAGAVHEAVAAYEEFATHLAALDVPRTSDEVQLEFECEPQPVTAGKRVGR